eukprot:CAMPEP_0185034232 /NCGR_PEP_ID=MMETSP1103-20130426/23917_1 /TAXON_ID=36769 /ORGANISM="Paraphysomonas bandaiensis, Strain Caron Lab Isolate" /LENGTH=394 /DNA_ID=CAMNT_0027570805 /DNA_START=31 /DNA_END=1215 /DNA_ORIENTATION=+
MEARKTSTPPEGSARSKTEINSSLKLKKFLASKMSESSSGRRVIHRFTGSIGIQIMDAIYSALVKFSNVRVAKGMRVNIYKVATKSAVLVHAGIITDEMMRSCKESNVLLMFCLIEQLQCPVHLRDPQVILSLAEDCYRQIYSILCPLQSSCSERLQAFWEFLVSGGFLDFFLMSQDVELERAVLLNNLNQIMAPYQDDAAQLALFLKDSLQARRRELSTLITRPMLINYLRHQDTFKLIQEWLLDVKGEEAMQWLSFYTSVREYMAISSRSLLPSRAAIIYDKFICPSAPRPLPLPDSVRTTMQDKILIGQYPKNLFSEALSHMVTTLRADFEDSFLSSSYFTRLQDELTMIDKKMIAFFHEDPTEFMYSDIDGDDIDGQVKMSMFERMSFWN